MLQLYLTKSQKLRDQEWEAILFSQLVPLQWQKFHDKVSRNKHHFCEADPTTLQLCRSFSERGIILSKSHFSQLFLKLVWILFSLCELYLKQDTTLKEQHPLKSWKWRCDIKVIQFVNWTASCNNIDGFVLLYTL